MSKDGGEVKRWGLASMFKELDSILFYPVQYEGREIVRSRTSCESRDEKECSAGDAYQVEFRLPLRLRSKKPAGQRCNGGTSSRPTRKLLVADAEHEGVGES